MTKAGMLKSLYIKEMRCLATDTGVTLGLVVLSSIFVFSRSGDAASFGYIFFPVVLMGGLAMLMPVISSFRILNGEWQNNTIYLTLSLPVKGGMVLGSKLLALLTQYVVGTLAVGISGIFLGFHMMPDFGEMLKLGEKWLPWDFYVCIYLIGLAFLAYVISLSFLSQLIGSLFTRLKGGVTALVFVALWWLFKKVDMVIVDIFSLRGIGFLEPGQILINLFSWAFTIIAAEALIVFVLAVLVYNNKVEL